MLYIKITIGLIILLAGCSRSDSDEDFTPIGVDNPGASTAEVVVLEDEINGQKVVLAGNVGDSYIVSFKTNINNVELNFTSSDDGLPIIMTDNEGNKWDIFGYAVEGPRQGQRLSPTVSGMGYWFAFATFFPGIAIYPENDTGPFFGQSISGTNNWLIPHNEVRSGGVGRDGIPALSTPQFENASTVKFLNNSDLVVGIRQSDKMKAYPHNVLDWHEIVNDQLDNHYYSIIYCPLTGTATAWNRSINGNITSFGVSGLLFNSNIIPYDRLTQSNWSQLFYQAVSGSLKGTNPETYMTLETKWSTWKKLYPESTVMNLETGFSRDYQRYPYGNYKTESSLIFPVKFHDSRLHEKERVHAIIVNEKARVYRFNSFSKPSN